ncbi:FAD(NAD)-dependent oxidoreductase [Enterococcus faecium]|nr:FAD(NAD)-dependent oxidoreductase [Enterococcus faecium]
MKIGIIGAGPRGLSVAERILHNNQDRHSLELFLFDPNGPGGRVWRLNQPPELLMNSVSQQVTLFTDETLSSGGLVTQGPNLFQWSKGPATDYIEQTVTKNKQLIIEEINRLEKDQQSTRCLYGLYQRWFFSKLQEEFPASIQFVYSLVKKVSKRKDGYLLQTDQQSYSVDQLVLASGHWENDETEEERVWVDYAKKNDLLYQLPSNPADVDLSKIPPKENVFLRGLGLSFF